MNLCVKCYNKKCKLKKFYMEKQYIKVLYCPNFISEKKYKNEQKEKEKIYEYEGNV